MRRLYAIFMAETLYNRRPTTLTCTTSNKHQQTPAACEMHLLQSANKAITQMQLN